MGSKKGTAASTHRGVVAVILDSDSEPQDDEDDDKPLMQCFRGKREQAPELGGPPTVKATEAGHVGCSRKEANTALGNAGKSFPHLPIPPPCNQQQQQQQGQPPDLQQASQQPQQPQQLRQGAHSSSKDGGFAAALERLNVLAFDRPQR